jgi:hypothetical protein
LTGCSQTLLSSLQQRIDSLARATPTSARKYQNSKNL